MCLKLFLKEQTELVLYTRRFKLCFSGAPSLPFIFITILRKIEHCQTEKKWASVWRQMKWHALLSPVSPGDY